MLTLRKVAVTGGLSCGKSVVCRFLSKRGAYYVSADKIVHEILSPQSSLGQTIIQLLGEEIVSGFQFDRTKIANKVFKDKTLLKSLEHLLHPAVLKEIENRYQQVKHNPSYTLFVAEIPLLYESESAHFFDIVIAVISDPLLAQERFQTHTHYPAEEFEKRMTHQLSIKEKSARANYTIVNNSDLLALEEQVDSLLKHLTH